MTTTYFHLRTVSTLVYHIQYYCRVLLVITIIKYCSLNLIFVPTTFYHLALTLWSLFLSHQCLTPKYQPSQLQLQPQKHQQGVGHQCRVCNLCQNELVDAIMDLLVVLSTVSLSVENTEIYSRCILPKISWNQRIIYYRNY